MKKKNEVESPLANFASSSLVLVLGGMLSVVLVWSCVEAWNFMGLTPEPVSRFLANQDKAVAKMGEQAASAAAN